MYSYPSFFPGFSYFYLHRASVPALPNLHTRTSCHLKCRIDRFKESRVAERLEQALHRAMCEQFWADVPISLSGHEDDRDRLLAKLQFPHKVGSGHSRHIHVQDQTPRLVHAIGREKLLRRRKGLSRKSELFQQVGQRLAHRLVVINHGNERTFHEPLFLGLHHKTMRHCPGGVHCTLVLVLARQLQRIMPRSMWRLSRLLDRPERRTTISEGPAEPEAAVMKSV